MAEIGITAGAKAFRAVHPIAMIFLVDDAVAAHGFEEAGPAAGAGEFGVGHEELISTHCTIVGAFCFLVPVFSFEWRFGGLFAGRGIKCSRQYFLPFGIGYAQFFGIRI